MYPDEVGEGMMFAEVPNRHSAYADRREAGAELARVLPPVLTEAKEEDPSAAQPSRIVLALPRGGVPVAEPVAEALDVPLDLLVVRKLGVPGQPEVAMGAIAATANGLVKVDSEEVVEYVRRSGIGQAEIDRVEAAEIAELYRRERAYRADRPPLDLEGRVVILVDDGIATGSTMTAAVGAVRAGGAARVIVALPVIVGRIPRALEEAVDAIVCPWIARDLPAVGLAYRRFDQTSDDEVHEILHRAWGR